ncbi:hypothetical protein [Pseudokineococcus sp. 1T1Z-3]|uniref:hypothetical protein n=1 Tax=Pseudokineococcus sp. 1T1Z-3 TaxID=3132745 RepID=UPI0030AF47B7
MEIGDWLRGRTWALVVLLLVPLVAGGAATAVAAARPALPGATATVEVPALVGASGAAFSGSSAVDQYAAAVVSAATGPRARQAAAEASGLSQGAVGRGLDVRRDAGSSRVLVRWTAADDQVGEQVATGVVDSVVATAADAVFGAPVAIAEQRLTEARERFAEASRQVSEVGAEAGVADPRQAYSSQLSLVNSLVTQTAAAQARGQGVGALETALAQARAGLEPYPPLLAELDRLEGEQDVAERLLQDAQADLDEARDEQAAAEPAVTTTTRSTAVGGLRPAVADAGLPAAAAGLVLAVLLVVLVESVRGRRRRARGEVSGEQLFDDAGRDVEPAAARR